jgi:hypothetical protein
LFTAREVIIDWKIPAKPNAKKPMAQQAIIRYHSMLLSKQFV